MSPLIPINVAGIRAMISTPDKETCSEPGCANPHRYVARCDYPILRSGRQDTCGAKLCAMHATWNDHGVILCRPHARLLSKAGQ